MNIFDQYGIKEVADVTIYSIHKKTDGSGSVYYVPALYLDTLKVTTAEKTAENTWAQGGLGNSRLISWDYGKTINLTLEDALCTPASLGLCWGGILGADWKDGQVNHQTALQDLNCTTERISRLEKAFYPRNDTVNAVVSNLLPRDGSEDILLDHSGDPVYLQRSTVLDGVNVKGFGYVNGKPYKWRLEIESNVKSVAVVPDRFFSIYGKSYPIKRQQTVGINQPSQLFKYEIIYKRGYDESTQTIPAAKIIYHAQMEGRPVTDTKCAGDAQALDILDNFSDYPYLKIRVCWDNSIRAYLGKETVDWDEERQLEDTHASSDTAWVEIPQINTDQFRDIDLWVRFDSLNALSYYLQTKYENNIYGIGPKEISGGILRTGYWYVPRGQYALTYLSPTVKLIGTAQNTLAMEELKPAYELTLEAARQMNESVFEPDAELIQKHDITFALNIGYYVPESLAKTSDEAVYLSLLMRNTCLSQDWKLNGKTLMDIQAFGYPYTGTAPSEYKEFIVKKGASEEEDQTGVICLPLITREGSEIPRNSFKFKNLVDNGDPVYHATPPKEVSGSAGLDYTLNDPTWTQDTSGCTPCCKKDNLSRSIWAYINPKTMTPYPDDYWFHANEPYYKKSLTLSTKENPLKAKKIVVEQGVFPGMYKIVAETYIRERETGEDQRVQITLPLCKIKSDNTLTLQADGDPTTFNLDVEVATPPSGVPMEIIFYDVEKEMKSGCSGNMIPKDGSTRIAAQ